MGAFKWYEYIDCLLYIINTINAVECHSYNNNNNNISNKCPAKWKFTQLWENDVSSFMIPLI